MSLLVLAVNQWVAPWGKQVAEINKAIDKSGGEALMSKNGFWLRAAYDFINIDKKDTSFYLFFQLKLHRDFQPFLEWLRDSVFGHGSITINPLAAYLRVSKFDALETRVLPIFDLFSLNTKKYLDFCCWKEALFLKKQYKNGFIPKPIYIEKMLDLKSQMNKSRTNFSFPSHFSINITDYWLLGFTEGDGSFNYNPKNGIDYPRYSMKNRNESALAIEGVKSYLGIGITY